MPTKTFGTLPCLIWLFNAWKLEVSTKSIVSIHKYILLDLLKFNSSHFPSSLTDYGYIWY